MLPRWPLVVLVWGHVIQESADFECLGCKLRERVFTPTLVAPFDNGVDILSARLLSVFGLDSHLFNEKRERAPPFEQLSCPEPTRRARDLSLASMGPSKI